MIHYIGFYTREGNPNNFHEIPSCNGKMGYILDCLREIGENVSVISLGQSSEFHKPKRLTSRGTHIDFIGTVPRREHFIWKIFARLYLLFQIFTIAVRSIQKEDKVIVYHSTAITPVIKLLYLCIRFELIYEVEEIYAAAWQKTDDQISREIHSIRFADKYILVNDLMAKQLGINKPYIVCYGSYKVSPYANEKSKDPDRIKLVYAGVLGMEGSDIDILIKAMSFLPSNYLLYIAGYGSEETIKYIHTRAASHTSIKYVGLLHNEKYSRLLSSCDIGLCPRLLDDKLSSYTFPSKILVYLSHGLIAISSSISAVKCSHIAKEVSFIEDLSPEGIAKAVLKIDTSRKGKGIMLLNRLDTKFKHDIYQLLNIIQS